MTGACDPCLLRALLLGRLAAHIERVATGRPGSRSRELLALPNAELARAVAGDDAGRLLAGLRAAEPDRLRAELDAAGCWTTCRHRDIYPASLRDLGDEAPASLLGRGEPSILKRLSAEPAVTVVGSRRSAHYGRGVAHELGRMLAAAGVTVVSGLALGVDMAAQAGALDEGGITAAILGSGPDRAYPPSARRLYARIVEHGLVLSELPPGSRAFRWTFPARNRIMAALGAMTVVVEAAAQSGSLITAEFAQQLGRQVGAVPGSVQSSLSEGTNALLKDGAHVVRGAQDVLDLMLGPGVAPLTRTGPALDAELGRVLTLVEQDRRSADDVALGLGGDARQAAAALARLELLGYVASDFTGAYTRTTLAPPARAAPP